MSDKTGARFWPDDDRPVCSWCLDELKAWLGAEWWCPFCGSTYNAQLQRVGGPKWIGHPMPEGKKQIRVDRTWWESFGVEVVEGGWRDAMRPDQV